MTLEQLRIFVAVAERLHMTRAAEALHITQSAASAAVAALEERYGALLFDRVGRGLVLSEAGRLFLPEAKAVLGRADNARQVLDDLAGLKRGLVTIHASQTSATYWLPPRLARFARAYPQIELRLSIGNTAQVARAVMEGEAELGFVEGPVEEPSLAHARIASDRLTLVTAPSHRLVSVGTVTPDDLAAASWVLREPGSGTRAELEHALLAIGVDPARLNAVLVLPSNEAIAAAVSAGGLIAAVSELAVKSMVEIGRLCQPVFEFPERPFELLTHKERRRSRAAAAFIERLGTE
ncbi:MAG TPA: LysR substrate-binding domain-containing protein [Aliidongia sp.]|nr:LysR substrate-binding domain-containing protein [Aliidongia sp.]